MKRPDEKFTKIYALMVYKVHVYTHILQAGFDLSVLASIQVDFILLYCKAFNNNNNFSQILNFNRFKILHWSQN